MKDLFEIEKRFIDFECHTDNLIWIKNNGIEIKRVYITDTEAVICFTTDKDIFDKTKKEFEDYEKNLFDIIENIIETYNLSYTENFNSMNK
ncbi:hypothetical protein DLH72_03010, partial [Candidatus Gracilibacteria bacterium]